MFSIIILYFNDKVVDTIYAGSPDAFSKDNAQILKGIFKKPYHLGGRLYGKD